MKVINDLLGYRNMKIVQDSEMFSFSLDSILLPNFVTINKNIYQILDIGCGNAPIPLILSTKTKSKIIGVEIQKDVCDIAVESIKINNKEEQITILNTDINDYYKNVETDTFDIITCNPPFFKYCETSNINKNDYKTIARHEVKLNLNDIFNISKKLLKNNGVIAMVHRPERLVEIIEGMKKNNIEPKKIQFVYPKKNSEANILLIEGSKNGKPGLKILPPIYTHLENGEYTDQIKNFLNRGEYMSQKSYDNSPSLYLIPTPIGNMEDITIRALNTLKKVDVVFCEDTRVTGQLLKYFDISKKLISSHNYNEAGNKDKLLDYLRNGSNVGLVSDRGTPIISDPGYELAKCAIENNFNVVSLPGATALIPALTSSGINPMPFYYYGFLNSKDSSRRKELENLKNIEATLILYEAPHRINKTLIDLGNILGNNRKISISREITKKYEEIYRGTIAELIEQSNEYKGELVIVVEGNKEIREYKSLTIKEHVNLYIEDGKSVMDSIKIVARERGMKKSEVYDIFHNIEKM